MVERIIPFNKPFIAGKELYYISQAVHKGHLSGDGFFTKKCHTWLEKRIECLRAFLTHSCTAALEMSAVLCDLQPGDEVIMPSFTFVSTANAFTMHGGTAVFIDIRDDTLNMDEQLIERAITSKTKAIVPVHYAGVSCEMDTVLSIAKEHGLIVVEDAAQALLSSYKGRFLGSIGHMGCLSFHETKNINCGEGGALLINDNQFIERAEIIREKGTNRSQFFRNEVDKYTWIDIGSSFLPSELTGAFLYAQLEMADHTIAYRNRLFMNYYEMLRPLEKKGFIRLPIVAQDNQPNGHIFYILTRTPVERAKLIRYLHDRGILAIIHFIPLHSSPAGRKLGALGSEMRVTDKISETILRLPLFYGMSDDEVNQVADAVMTFYTKAA